MKKSYELVIYMFHLNRPSVVLEHYIVSYSYVYMVYAGLSE